MKSNKQKTFLILRLSLLTGAIILAIIQMIGIWDKANIVAMLLLGSALLVQSVQEWSFRRRVGVVCLFASAIFLYCAVYAILG